MAWRKAYSLEVMLAEVDALHPGRDKRTDGAISGYPGSRSSHNVNAAGVVCAVDITTGDRPGGISTADGQALAERLRIASRDQPRGITVYGIHYMAPPYVAVAGPKICTAPDYEWRHYNGEALHKDHIHWSADTDILTGEAPTGLADYDLGLSWLKATSLTEMDIDMATPEQVVNALLLHKITLKNGQTARFIDHFVNLCDDAQKTLKAGQVITSMDGTKATVAQAIANTGADMRAVKTVTDGLKK